MSKLFQIRDEDLEELERVLPQWVDRLTCGVAPNGASTFDNRLRTQVRRVQDILKDVRWNYGPPGDISFIPAGDGGGD